MSPMADAFAEMTDWLWWMSLASGTILLGVVCLGFDFASLVASQAASWRELADVEKRFVFLSLAGFCVLFTGMSNRRMEREWSRFHHEMAEVRAS